MSQTASKPIKYADWIQPSAFSVYLQDPSAAFEVHGDADNRPGHVFDLDYRLGDYYNHVSSRYTFEKRIDETPISGPQEVFKAGTVTISFLRDRLEGHIKGARFTSPLREDLEAFLNGLQELKK